MKPNKQEIVAKSKSGDAIAAGKDISIGNLKGSFFKITITVTILVVLSATVYFIVNSSGKQGIDLKNSSDVEVELRP